MADHDKLFKRAFRVPEHAAGELAAVLPKGLLEAIDPGSLELVQGDFVAQQLNERFTDALFSARFSGTLGYVVRRGAPKQTRPLARVPPS